MAVSLGTATKVAAMDLRQLRYFIALAEEKHFGRAAKRLSLSQPPLSHAIRQLEEELGAVLFERTSRRVALTPAGTALLREAQAILQRTANARALVHDIARGRRGRLRIGFSGSMIYRGLPQILAELRVRSPDIEVELQEMNSAAQVEALRHDEIHVGFIHVREAPEGLDGDRYHSEPFVACLPSAHAVAAGRSTAPLRLTDLRNEDFILFSRHVSPEYYESIIAICLEAGFLPKVRFEVRQWLSIVALVGNEAGVALVPRALARSEIAGVRFVPLPRSTIQSETWCVWRDDDEGGAIRSAFLEQVRAHQSNLIGNAQLAS
jgi:DNA-binding transcriptional LysR family regulator